MFAIARNISRTKCSKMWRTRVELLDVKLCCLSRVSSKAMRLELTKSTSDYKMPKWGAILEFSSGAYMNYVPP